MAQNELLIYEFRPLCLSMERIGPFQDGVHQIDFTDKEDEPCNFFLLVSKNGFGKTTILNTLSRLLNLLGQAEPKSYGLEDLDKGQGRAQLDIKMRVFWQGKDHHFVLSILAGNLSKDLSLNIWDKDSLQKYNTNHWYRMGYTGQQSGFPLKPLTTHKSEDFIGELLISFQTSLDSSPSTFGESVFSLPTTLSFSAYRDIPSISSLDERPIIRPQHWGYKPIHTFSPHNEGWNYSLDNLLVWLKWLDDGRFEKARDLINKQVFEGTAKYLKDVRRDPPEAIVYTEGDEPNTHRLDQLSSGEKNLAQLFLRIGSHMTKNTILLIDEFDVHLHIRWQYRLYNALKALAARQDVNFTVIATTHSTEMLQTFVDTMEMKEDGLVKGGHLIKHEME